MDRGSQELLWGLVMSQPCVQRCPRAGRARRLPAACLPEQMGAVKGETLAIALPAESRSRPELPFPFTFPQLVSPEDMAQV